MFTFTDEEIWRSRFLYKMGGFVHFSPTSLVNGGGLFILSSTEKTIHRRGRSSVLSMTVTLSRLIDPTHESGIYVYKNFHGVRTSFT